jgi:hypothetical protein
MCRPSRARAKAGGAVLGVASKAVGGKGTTLGDVFVWGLLGGTCVRGAVSADLKRRPMSSTFYFCTWDVP